MREFDYDLFVIGGGSGGVRAARIAAGEHGAKVALAEEYRMGGTCVIRGCVPKKLMVFASDFPTAIADDARPMAGRCAAAASTGRASAGCWMPNSTGWRAPTAATSPRPGSRLRRPRRAGDPHTVRLSDRREFHAAHILVATGGTPFVPEFPGSDLVQTSNDIFLWDSLPKSVVIVGGGYIACEFACILNGLGVEVTQFYRGAQVLRGFDDESRGHIAEGMKQNGVNLHVGTEVERIERAGDGLRVICTMGTEQVVDRVIYATGRVPNSRGIGLEAAGVGLSRYGAVKVDEWSQTAVPSIYAVGDVTDRINLTPVAIREGQAFAETVFKSNPTRADHETVASAVFTRPEYGWCRPERGGGARRRPDRDLHQRVPAHAFAVRGSRRQGADETDRLCRYTTVARVPYRRGQRGRDDPACGHRDQDGRHQGRFRPHGGGASHHVRGTGDDAQTGARTRRTRLNSRHTCHRYERKVPGDETRETARNGRQQWRALGQRRRPGTVAARRATGEEVAAVAGIRGPRGRRCPTSTGSSGRVRTSCACSWAGAAATTAVARAAAAAGRTRCSAGAASSRGSRTWSLWTFNSLYSVKPEERSVELLFGEYLQTGNPGLNFAPWPVVTHEIVQVTGERTAKSGQSGSGRSLTPG